MRGVRGRKRLSKGKGRKGRDSERRGERERKTRREAKRGGEKGSGEGRGGGRETFINKILY